MEILIEWCGCTSSEAHQLVDYVFGRPVGDIYQEIGGVMVTLAALCLAQNQDMRANGELELERIWTKIDKIRQKQAAKPRLSPLPEVVESKCSTLPSEDEIVHAGKSRYPMRTEGFIHGWHAAEMYHEIRRL